MSGATEWSENDHDQFMFAIKQPLLVQTPLQLMLEMLSDRMKAQTAMVGDLKAAVDKMFANSAAHSQLVERMQAIEAQVAEMPAALSNPFAQNEILERLKAVEWTSKEAMDTIQTQVSVHGHVLESRVDDLEKRMTGKFQLHCIDVLSLPQPKYAPKLPLAGLIAGVFDGNADLSFLQ